MRTASKSIALIRRQPQKSIGSILLPDQFTVGSSVESSGYRIAELIDGLGLAPGVLVILGEMSSQELSMVGEDIHRAPVEFVLAYIESGICHPLQNVVLIRKDPKEDKVAGSELLFMPDCSKPPSTTGEIIAIGPDVKDPDIKLGARALIALFAGLEVFIDKIGVCVLVRTEALKNHSDELLGVFVDD